MPWLVIALIALLLGGLSAHGTHNEVFSYFLFGGAFLCAIAIGRLREAKRVAAWTDAARWVGGTYRGAQPDEFLARFGTAPWHTWSKARSIRCTRLIEGPGHPADFALFSISFFESSSGDTDPAYDVTMAAVPVLSDPPHEVVTVPVDDRHHALHNGRFLFVWRRAFAAVGRNLRPDELPALLQQARVVAREFQQSPPRLEPGQGVQSGERGLPLLVGLGWAAVIAAPFFPSYQPWAIILIAVGWTLAALGLDWRRVSSASHWAFLVGIGLAAWGLQRGNALMLFGIPIGLAGVLIVQAFATSKTTRRDARGRLVWLGSASR